EGTMTQDKLLRRVMIGGTVAAIVVLLLLQWRVHSEQNQDAQNAHPKGVTVAVAHAAEYREAQRYIGTLEPWQQAHVGPQWSSAYVDTVLVRPGQAVKKGEVIATLDCRQAANANSAIAAQARALEAKQTAISGEATRVEGLLERGYVSQNEVEQH